MLPQKIAFVDIETTGGSLRTDRVIEIGIVRVEDGKITKTFKSLINPERYLPAEITILTGIHTSEIENAPTFYDIKDHILEILEDCVFVAHNVRFDFSFLKNEFKRYEIEFNPKHFCTVKLSRALYPQHSHHNLDSIIERFGYKVKNRHRAFDDAEVLWKFYQDVQKEFEEEFIYAALNRAMKRPTIPIQISQQELDDLPECPGVYLFFGQSGTPLYIGKSVNIRKRVLQHFSSDHLSSTELKIAQQVQRIETIKTAGELGALFKEASLVKKMQPLYNRQLRLLFKLVILRKKEFESGYYGIDLDQVDYILPEETPDIYGVFRSKKAAKDYLKKCAKEFKLCEKLLGLESGKGECFNRRLERCEGACIGDENKTLYNFKFTNAFQFSQLEPWPYSGPIMIEERGEDADFGEAFLVDKWCYLGNIKAQEQSMEHNLEQDIQFDLDTYRILRRFLKNPKNRRYIKPLSGHTPSMFEDFSVYST